MKEILLEDRIKLATVSGVLTTKPNLIKWVDLNMPEIEIITSKSYQVSPNKGNREPVIVEDAAGNFGNAVGLKNPGMEEGYRQLVNMLNNHPMRALLNISLSANSIEDYITLVKKFESIADMLELNFSCPHAAKGYGSAIGTSPELVKGYMEEIRKHTDALIFTKLTPNVDNIGEIAKVAVDAGADGITAINTVGPVEHIEPYTGKSVLTAGKGGKSGEWIKETALEKIKDIRAAIGDNVPIIGIGGVSNGEDVWNLMEAGANVVGLGSVLSRVPRQDDIPEFVYQLKQDALHGNDDAQKFLSNERLMEYKPYRIKKMERVNGDLTIFTLENKLDSEPSQFAFIWLPGIGEKPFSIAKNDPLTFVVRKRGEFTKELFKMQDDQELMIRGVYGNDAPSSSKNNAYIVAGGTGIAVVPELARKLKAEGKNVKVYYGVKTDDELDVVKKLGIEAECCAIADHGTPARVLEYLQDEVKDAKSSSFYNIGHFDFMNRAKKIERELGAKTKDIYSSFELNTLCGIGMCGECECGGKLLCKEGTFVSQDYLDKNRMDLMDFE